MRLTCVLEVRSGRKFQATKSTEAANFRTVLRKIMSHEDRRRRLRGCSLLERRYRFVKLVRRLDSGPGGGKVEEGRSWLDPVRVLTYSWTWLNVRNMPPQLGPYNVALLPLHVHGPAVGNTRVSLTITRPTNSLFQERVPVKVPL